LWKVQEVGVVPLEEDAESHGRTISGGVNLLNELIDVRRHDKEIANSVRTGVPVGVRGSARNEDG